MVVSKPRKRPSAENVYFNPAGLGVNLIDPPRLPLAELRAQNARGRETHRCQNYISFLPCMHLVRLLRAVLWNVPACTLKKRHEAHVFTRGPEPTPTLASELWTFFDWKSSSRCGKSRKVGAPRVRKLCAETHHPCGRRRDFH